MNWCSNVEVGPRSRRQAEYADAHGPTVDTAETDRRRPHHTRTVNATTARALSLRARVILLAATGPIDTRPPRSCASQRGRALVDQRAAHLLVEIDLKCVDGAGRVPEAGLLEPAHVRRSCRHHCALWINVRHMRLTPAVRRMWSSGVRCCTAGLNRHRFTLRDFSGPMRRCGVKSCLFDLGVSGRSFRQSTCRRVCVRSCSTKPLGATQCRTHCRLGCSGRPTSS
jgi:hypothetical protein